MAGDTTASSRSQTERVAPDVTLPSETLAAIDIGTNSVHGVVARMTAAEGGPRFEVLEREKEMVRLGSILGGIITATQYH